MAKNPLSTVDETKLLGEIEDIIRVTPAYDVLGRNNDDSLIWLGRAVAALGNWDMVAGIEAKHAADEANNESTFTSEKGARKLKTLLHTALADLRLTRVGPVNSAIGQGRTFEYFDELRKIIGLATSEIWFVDPYMDGDFVSRYLTHVGPGVSMKLLGRRYMSQLVSAVQALAQQQQCAVEVRSSEDHHDRFVFVDGAFCYQSGASFKDGGHAVTTITQITDAFPELRAKDEAIWQAAKQQLKV